MDRLTRTRSDANTRYNIISVMPGDGASIARSVVLQAAPESGVTPGSIVIPFSGNLYSGNSFSGATGIVQVPTAFAGRHFAVLDLSMQSGGNITAVYLQNDQVPAFFPAIGSCFNVRISSTSNLTSGALVTYATNNSGMVVPGTEANAIARLRHDVLVQDENLPTWVLVERIV